MNYVSMQIHRFSRESLAMVVLGDTFLRFVPIFWRRDALHFTLTVGVQKKALEPKFPFGRLSFPFFNLGTKLLNWVFGETKSNQAESSVWILYHFLLCFFSDTSSQAFLEAALVVELRLNNPQSARGRWKWPSILQWSTSSKEPAGERQELRKKNQSPLSTKTRSFAPLFLDHRRAAAQKKRSSTIGT